MVRQLLAVALIGAVSVLAAGGNKAGSKQTGEVKADSMVYDEPTQWRIFSIDGPSAAFALQGDLLWLASDKQVASMSIGSTKKSEVVRYKTLGTMTPEGITCIAVDRQGGVWFGGNNGIAVKNGTQFTTYTTESGLPDNGVTAIAVTPDGTVWAGTGNGLSAFSAGSWKKYGKSEGLVSDKIQALLVDKNGHIWIATDKGISVYGNGKWTTHSMKNGMSWNDTKAFGLDKRTGTVWAAAGEKDVNSFDGKTWNVYMDIAQGINSIMVDSRGRVWFGSATGLIKFNGDDWINDVKKLGVPAAQVNQMLSDEEGNLWYGMESGVIRLANPYPH
jgi:ligand-binding sensor domain-containing protein